MRSRQGFWAILKVLLGLTILVVVGVRFARDLRRPDLWQRPIHFEWLVLSGLLYLGGIGFSALYWRRLLVGLGERPTLVAVLRAYYVGHLGKYLPGKAWALLLRVGLIRSANAPVGRFGIVTLTAIYEVLATMASGALLAAILFALFAPRTGVGLDPERLWRLLSQDADAGALEWAVVVPLALLLAIITGLPLVPSVFNILVRRFTIPVDDPNREPPELRIAWLVEGLLLTALGWLLQGASVIVALHAILGGGLTWTTATLGRVIASQALANVAGFVILVAPAGLGVREFILTVLLAPDLERIADLEPEEARGVAVLTALVVRLVWTASELLLAGTLYWWPVSASGACQRPVASHRGVDTPRSPEGETS